MHAEPVVTARVFQHDWRLGVARQRGGNQVGVLVLILVAESSAHIVAHDAHLLVFQAQIPGHVMAAIGNALGRGIQGQRLALPVRQGAAGFQLRVVHKAGVIALCK